MRDRTCPVCRGRIHPLLLSAGERIHPLCLHGPTTATMDSTPLPEPEQVSMRAQCPCCGGPGHSVDEDDPADEHACTWCGATFSSTTLHAWSEDTHRWSLTAVAS